MVQPGDPVKLHVYDLSQGLARQMSISIIGKSIDAIYHTGVVVFGKEYWFGGGIQSSAVGMAPYGNPIKILDLGYTEVPEDLFNDFLHEISDRYTPATYSLLNHNCNNFSDEVAHFLLGKGIPDYILSLPREVTSTPVGALLVPMLEQIESGLRHGGTSVSHPPQPVPYHMHPQPNPSPNPLSTSNSHAQTTSTQINNPDTTSHGPNISSEKAPDGNLGVKVPNNSNNAPTSEPLKGVDGAASEETAKSVPGKDSVNGDVPKVSKDEAKMRMQAEIAREFATIMASGRYGANEAASLALQRVMKQHHAYLA